MTEPVLHFSREEFRDRIAKTRRAMDLAGVDLIIVSDPSNMAWLTGYDGWSFYVHQAVLLAQNGDPVWFGRGQDANGAKRTCFMVHDDIVGYPDHYVQSTERHPMDVLSSVIDDRGWSGARIGVEMDNYWFSAKAFASLQSHLPNARFSDATGLVNWQRAVKSPQELGYMRKAARLVERMHQRIADVVEPGMRKCDLVAEIYDASIALRRERQHGWRLSGDRAAAAVRRRRIRPASDLGRSADEERGGNLLRDRRLFIGAITVRCRGPCSSASRRRHSSMRKRPCWRAWMPVWTPRGRATAARTSRSPSLTSWTATES